MTGESFLSKKLQKFSVLDLVLVKLVYLFIGILVFSIYVPLSQISWWFYLILTMIAAFPLYLHTFSFSGDYFSKAKMYVKTNNPSNQVLLFLTMFFFAGLLATFFPALVQFHWWYYLIVIIVLAVKPLKSTIFW